jgi:riboflavin kinase / FMN adenylyltransferase
MAEHFHGDAAALPPGSPGTVATVGTFDGVHRGHQAVVRRVVERAAAAGLRSLVVTFEPHPSEVVRPDRVPPLLTLPDERLEVLAQLGVNYCVVLPFTPELAQYDAEAFVRLVLMPRFGMRELLVGFDNGFGRDRAGSVEVLQRLGGEIGFPVEVVEPVTFADGTRISSTAVRQAVAAGELERASEGLGRAYGVSGTVVRGEQRGRTIGYPTLNLGAPSTRKLLPPSGVYAVRAQTPLGVFGGMLNLGPRPTFGDEAVSLEAHLFDAAGDYYGTRVRLDFVSRLRDVRRFGGPDELREQLRRDDEAARRVLAEASA